MVFTFQNTNPSGDYYSNNGLNYVNLKPEIREYINWEPNYKISDSKAIFGTGSIYEYKCAGNIISIILRNNPKENELCDIFQYIFELVKLKSNLPKIINLFRTTIFIYASGDVFPRFQPKVRNEREEVFGERFEVDALVYEFEITTNEKLELIMKENSVGRLFQVTPPGFTELVPPQPKTSFSFIQPQNTIQGLMTFGVQPQVQTQPTAFGVQPQVQTQPPTAFGQGTTSFGYTPQTNYFAQGAAQAQARGQSSIFGQFGKK